MVVVRPAAVLALPALNIVRTAARRHRGFGTPWGHAWLYASFCLLAKPAHLQGMATFAWSRLRGRRTGLIEYRRLA